MNQVRDKRADLILLAQAGDEVAFQAILHEFEGLIWKTYQQQRVRTQPIDWQHECRSCSIKRYDYCITKLGRH